MFSLAETAIGMFEETDFILKACQPEQQDANTNCTQCVNKEPLGSLEFTAVYSAAFYFMILHLWDNTQSRNWLSTALHISNVRKLILLVHKERKAFCSIHRAPAPFLAA